MPLLHVSRSYPGRDPDGRPFALSRNRKDLARYFPELLHIAEGLSAGAMVDGEVVKPTPEGVSFLELQRRLMLLLDLSEDSD